MTEIAPPRVVLHWGKLNAQTGGWGRLAAMGKHNGRLRETSNADPERAGDNVLLRGTGDWEADARVRLADAATIRKNAVLGIEFILSASHSFFLDVGDEAETFAGEIERLDLDRLQRWAEASMAWLRHRFGGAANVVAAVLHRDELTPHIHALVVPIDERGRLNGRAFMGGSSARASDLHTEYWRAVEHLGLARGIQGSKATHQEPRAYYARIKEVTRQAQEIVREQRATCGADRTPPVMTRGQHAQALDRAQEAWMQHYEQLQSQVDHWQQRAERAETTTQSQARTITQQARTIEQLRAETEQLRQIDLADVLERLGGERDRYDKAKWRVAGEHISITGGQWFNWDRNAGGGGAIDLVRQVADYSFKDARGWLKDQFGVGVTTTAILARARPVVERAVQRSERPPFRPPERAEDRWAQVRHYLTERRRVPGEMVDALHRSGTVYADRRGNAVFLRRADDGTPTGAYLRGTLPGSTFKGLAAGTERAAGFFRYGVGQEQPYSRPALVLVESPIDALAYATLHPEGGRTIIVSTDGKGALPVNDIERADRAGWAIISAVDRDADGEKLAARMREVCPSAIRERPPVGKDWAEALAGEQQHRRAPGRDGRDGREGYLEKERRR